MSRTEYPMICNDCLPKEKYIKMVRCRKGAACKLCERPFDVYRWHMADSNRQKKTEICLDCAKTKNLCQCCVMDLEFNIPYYVRDAALAQVNAEVTTTSAVDAKNTRWMLDSAKERLAIEGKSDFDKIDQEKAANLLIKKHNYQSNVPGMPKRDVTKKEDSNLKEKEKNETNSKVKKAYVEKKPKKHQSFLK
ncbi:pre-mRNA-splicing factor SLT11, putative [Entamoeba invadens IP1]|uniref:Pre-mRNA-splicing factor SLT11, putative n=1 Tax=Entamoeba invadens IP1 TaxID=370355 RepID=A0A0A1U8Z4_ENTIV|nr:pre-mRNA-splicing factor SLT11, putative [Entamoeba invadens IP1]ELP89606.1 pre-mRNA-splicing factor SLT11, putative [Entamoeba invadens IP1]|eukprot:XP_004256377.1 pre-mRNA-splicing factor SLT11, putative [Entamoeba invadens IP1]